MGGRLFTPRNVPLRATPPVYNYYRPVSRHFLSIQSSFFLFFWFSNLVPIAEIFVDFGRGVLKGVLPVLTNY